MSQEASKLIHTYHLVWYLTMKTQSMSSYTPLANILLRISIDACLIKCAIIRYLNKFKRKFGRITRNILHFCGLQIHYNSAINKKEHNWYTRNTLFVHVGFSLQFLNCSDSFSYNRRIRITFNWPFSISNCYPSNIWFNFTPSTFSVTVKSNIAIIVNEDPTIISYKLLNYYK